MFKLADQICRALLPNTSVKLNHAYEIVDGFIGRQYPGIGIKDGTVLQQD